MCKIILKHFWYSFFLFRTVYNITLMELFDLCGKDIDVIGHSLNK